MSFDMYRVANAFLYGARNGNKEFCKNVVSNYAHVYRKTVQDVLAGLSVMFMDPTGFTPDEYIKVKTMLHSLMKEAKNDGKRV